MTTMTCIERDPTVNNYYSGYNDLVYKDATQYQACVRSKQLLERQIMAEDEYGPNYILLLKERLQFCEDEIIRLEEKYNENK